MILSELGENLIKATSAHEALAHLLRHEIAVVLIDVQMPELDGFELAAMIREHPRFQPTAIIFVSAIQLTDPDLLRGYEAGAVDYVPVPVVPEVLRAKVRVFADLYPQDPPARAAERRAGTARRGAHRRAGAHQRGTRAAHRAAHAGARGGLAQLFEVQKIDTIGQLTGGVAHDFNNLLMAMLGNLELLRKRLPDDPRRCGWSTVRCKGADRGATLTKRMLAFARRQELRPETVDVPRLVDGMGDLLRRTLGPGIQVVTAYRPDLPPVRVDPNQLELAMLNLALNARDAMPEGGRLVIGGSCVTGANLPKDLAPGRYVRLTVSDTGAGMDAATLKRAAEPFFTTKGTGKGTGLGLSMVHGVVAQSGGAMRITSQPGDGTTVELWLPLSETAATADTAPPVTSFGSPFRSYRVLVVDDDPLVVASTAAMLEDVGHVVTEALSGALALDMLKLGTEVDVVLTDHAMPGMTGVELAGQVRELWPDLPVILASGYAELPNGEETGLPRLSKPYMQDELAEQIAKVVGATPSNVIALDTARRA